MTGHRVGLWLIGAFGGVGTTVTVGLAAMARGLADRTGLVTELPRFQGLPLAGPGDFVIGGHDIRRTTFAESAEEFRRLSGIYPADWISACRDELAAASARIRPGTHLGTGRTISKLADWDGATTGPGARQAVDRIADDLAEFAKSESLDHVIVLNVASTEPPFPVREVHQRWDLLTTALAGNTPDLLPASCALRTGSLPRGPYVHQFHAEPGGVHSRSRRAGRPDGLTVRRQRWKDRRDPDEDRAGPDVRLAQPAGSELGRP